MQTIEHAPAPRGPDDAPGRRRWIAWIASVAVVATLAALFAWTRGGDDEVATPPAVAGPTVDRSTVIWPLAGSTLRFTDPVDAAGAFAQTYLRFESPVVGEFRQGDSRSGEVEVRPTASGPVTTVIVRRLTDDEAWSVLGAATDNIEVTSPRAGTELASPVHVAGRAHTFEGNVIVEVRQDGDGGPIGRGVVTGGGPCGCRGLLRR